MGNGDHRAGVVMQEALKPGHGLGIQVVGGFVEQQHVGAGEQQAAESHPAALTTGEMTYIGLPGRQAQCLGGNFQLALQVVGVGSFNNVFQPCLFGSQRVKVSVRLGVGGVYGVELGLGLHDLAQRFFDGLAHTLGVVELGFLRQIPDVDAGHGPRFALILLVDSRHDAQQGRFTGTIKAQHTDLGTGEEGERNVLENLLFGRNDLAHPIHGEDVLRHGAPQRLRGFSGH